MSNEPAAVLFDFGDTLVTLRTPREELFLRAATSIGLELDPANVQRAYQVVEFTNKFSSVSGQDRSTFYAKYNEQLCEVLGVSSHYPSLLPAITDAFANSGGWMLIEDAKSTLTKLQDRSMRLALVANWDSNLAAVAGRFGIRDYFSAIVASHAVGVEKPSPGIFKIALDELGLGSSEGRFFYVGNEYRADVLGARAAGLTPVLIDRSGQYPHADCLRYRSLSEWIAEFD